MDDFKDSPTALVADVDCTTEGKELCTKNDVRGYPSIMYGEVGELKKYEGARSYDAMKKFADENLGPTCGPGENIVHCDDWTKERIETFLKMSSGKLEGKIRKAVKDYEVEMPIMKKVAGWVRTGGKSEL